MSQKPRNGPTPFGRLMASSLLAYGLWCYPLDLFRDPVLRGFWWFLAGASAWGLLLSVPVLIGGAFAGSGRLFSLFRAFGRDTSKGSAGFLTERELRRVGLHRRKKGARFIGTVGRSALWLWTETHHLIVGPAGSAKTSAAIINILMGSAESALINDIKGELHETTKDHRAKAFGHEIAVIDPKHPEESINFNPLEDVSDAIENRDPKALTISRGIAMQLAPDPQGGGGANDVFYKGARGLIVTVMLAVCLVLPKPHRTFAMVYRMLSDMGLLHDLLEKASQTTALNGEIADMARNVHQQAFGDDGNAKTFESFRINAMLALEGFGPGNYLAAITSETTFHFRELKERKVSLYIKIDYANSDVLSAFSGLVQHLAAEAMVAEGTNTPVLFCLDEFVAAPCRKICSILVLLRSAGVKVIMACQDLNDIERAYSKHDLLTVLSETDIKQFLSVRSKTTLEWLTGYLGEYTETVSSFSMGEKGPQESLSRVNRKLLTEDELRRLPDNAQIVLQGNKKPILAKKVQVFAIAPWRKTVGVNSTYGSKRKLLPIEVRMRWFHTDVTPRAARKYRRIWREVFAKRGARARLFGHLLGALSVGPLVAVGVALAAFNYGPGLPNLRVSYTYTGSAQQTPRRYIQCRYAGPTSPGVIAGPNCPLILWRKP